MHTEKGDVPGATYDGHVSCPAHLEVIPRTVWEVLAAAVPKLQHLGLLGHCSDGALSAFGLVCPELHSLQVEASTVPIKALHHLHQYLPKLTHFSLFKRGSRGNNLQNFTLACFNLLQDCSLLAGMELDFGGKVEIVFNKEVWLQLPPGINHLRCTCPLQGLRHAVSLLANLKTLDVMASPYIDLLELLRLTPCLQALILQQKDYMHLDICQLYTDDGMFADDLPSLQQQLSTMRISCPSFLLRGCSNAVSVVMNWLQPICCRMLTVQLCSLESSPLNFLHQLPSLFPNLTTLELMDVRSIPDLHMPPAPLGQDCLGPVVQCQSLEKLFLRMRISLTSAGLAQLCSSLPNMVVVKCFACTGFNRKKFKTVLHPSRRAIKINFICEPKHL